MFSNSIVCMDDYFRKVFVEKRGFIYSMEYDYFQMRQFVIDGKSIKTITYDYVEQ